MKTTFPSAAACAVSLLCGCASYPVPSDHLANSYANIRAAQELGATSTPRAALHLKLAQEEQARAKSLVDDDKNEEADYMTLRANSDAELALAMARQSTADGRAAQASVNAQTARQDAANTAAAAATPSSFSATATTTTITGADVPASGKSK